MESGKIKVSKPLHFETTSTLRARTVDYVHVYLIVSYKYTVLVGWQHSTLDDDQ